MLKRDRQREMLRSRNMMERGRLRVVKCNDVIGEILRSSFVHYLHSYTCIYIRSSTITIYCRSNGMTMCLHPFAPLSILYLPQTFESLSSLTPSKYIIHANLEGVSFDDGFNTPPPFLLLNDDHGSDDDDDDADVGLFLASRLLVAAADDECGGTSTILSPSSFVGLFSSAPPPPSFGIET